MRVLIQLRWKTPVLVSPSQMSPCKSESTPFFNGIKIEHFLIDGLISAFWRSSTGKRMRLNRWTALAWWLLALGRNMPRRTARPSQVLYTNLCWLFCLITLQFLEKETITRIRVWKPLATETRENWISIRCTPIRMKTAKEINTGIPMLHSR